MTTNPIGDGYVNANGGICPMCGCWVAFGVWHECSSGTGGYVEQEGPTARAIRLLEEAIKTLRGQA